MTYTEIEFVVCCIEELAAECGMSGNDIYHLLADKTDMIVNYIVPNYEVLHSMGRNTIELFQNGLISEEETLGRLKYEKPNWQMCIRNQEILDNYLKYQRSEEIMNGSK